MNSVINCLTAKSTWDDLILYHEGPSDVKESRVVDLKLCYNTFKFKECESLTQTFTRFKALRNELVNDGIKLSKLEINTGFINGLPKNWLPFCQSLINTNHVKESELASLFGKLKYEENLIDSIYETGKEKTLEFQDSPDDEEDTRSSQEYMNDLEEKYQARALFAKSKRFFKNSTQRFSGAKVTDQTECHKCGRKGHFARDCFSKTSVSSYQSPFQPKILHSSEHKPELKHTKDFEAKYNKVKAKLALLSSSASSPKSSSGKNKGLIAETYEWDEEEVSSDENEEIEVKALMALTNEERVSVSKESASNSEWVKISIQKVHTLLEMEDNDDRKSFLDYLCIDLNYVEEQRNNLFSKHRNLVQELNTCKEQLLILNQAKIDLFTMQHVNTEILKENQNLRNELKELTSITETWPNSSNKVNQCISEQIPTQKRKILRIDQLTEDTSSSIPKDLIFVKSLADNLEVSITGSNKPKLSEAEDSTLSNHDTSMTIKSNLKSSPTFKAETLKGITLKEPSLAPVKDNKKGSSVSKTSSAPAGKLKNVKVDDDTPLAIHLFCKKCKKTDHRTRDHAKFMSSLKTSQHHIGQGESSLRSRPSIPVISFPSCIHCGYNGHQSDDCVYYPRCELCGSYDHDTSNHTRIISLRRGIKPRNPQHVIKHCETCGSNAHTTTDQ
ncbi:retrovirus-related pol polyprotein from transposon TNT 1-94 [Tanacetum coccineum]